MPKSTTQPHTYIITINPGSPPNPQKQECTPGDKICFTNNTPAPVTIVFTPPPPLAPPSIGPIPPNGGQGCGTVTAAGNKIPHAYHISPDGSLVNGGDGIIIVDPGGDPGKSKAKSKGKKKKKSASKRKAGKAARRRR